MVLTNRNRISPTILLLVSDPVIERALQDILEDAGFLVIAASDLGHAVARIGECRPDLLIIRSHIENIPGHDAAVYLRTKCPDVPVLIVAGMPEDDRIEVRESLQHFEIFPKPFPPSDLIAKVKEIVDKNAPAESA